MVTISALQYTMVPTVLCLTAIGGGYAIWLAEGKDPFLPTISNTWDTAPGTYFSRWLVGLATGCLALLQVFIYPEAAAGRGSTKQKLCLRVSLAAILCLSVVGSICDSPNRQCKGNLYVHSFFAITWFVLYDLVMLVSYERDLVLAVLATICTTTRTTYHTRLWWVACLEWTNILLVLVWSARRVDRDLRWGFGRLQHAVWSVTSDDLLKLCGVIYVSTLLVSCVMGLHAGYIPRKHRRFWFISDMWTNIPGNWLSRWAVMQGCHAGWVAHVAMFADSRTKLRRTGLVVAIVSLVGLSIVGCCDESENFPLHVTGALVFFYGYDIWTVCAVLDDASCRARVACAFVCWLCAPIHMRHIIHVPSSILDALAVLEWANALAIIGFMLLDGLVAHPSALAVGVVRAVPDGLAKPLL